MVTSGAKRDAKRIGALVRNIARTILREGGLAGLGGGVLNRRVMRTLLANNGWSYVKNMNTAVLPVVNGESSRQTTLCHCQRAEVMGLTISNHYAGIAIVRREQKVQIIEGKAG